MKRICLCLIVVSMLSVSAQAGMFANSVVDYNTGGGVVNPPQNDPLNALGAPDGATASLGDGGWITVSFAGVFSDQLGDDIFVVEGGQDEDYEIFIATAAAPNTWISVGTATGDGSVDISGAPLVDYTYVKIVDDTNEGATAGPWGGADIDSVEVATVIPTPTAFLLGGIGMALSGWKLRRKRQVA